MNTPSRNLSQRLVLYALGAGAVVGVASAGNGHKKKNTIHYSGPVEFSGDTIWFDLMDQTSPTSYPYYGDDFELFSRCKSGQNGFKKGAFVKGKNNSFEKSKIAVTEGKFHEPDAIEFHAGDTIGTQDFWFYGFMDSYAYNANSENFYHFGQWQVGDRGFLGLKIIIDCKSYFGWADVTLNTLDCEGGPVFTLHSYAINTEPNESIAAGEKKAKSKHLHLAAPTCTPTPTPTPTPSPITGAGAAMSLLIMGAAGIGSLKQRRQ
ncbi:MAG: hypothetical protein QOG48_1443 [Verrucomicrobiota bacterium]